MDEPGYNERSCARLRHALAGGCRIKRVCRPTLSLAPAVGTTGARLPITELIVIALVRSAPVRTQQDLREVIALYKQWACRDRRITGFLYLRHSARVHRNAATRCARVGGGGSLRKLDPLRLTRLRGGWPARLQANNCASPAVRWLNRRV